MEMNLCFGEICINFGLKTRKGVLEEGIVILRIGNGMAARFQKDPWLPTLPDGLGECRFVEEHKLATGPVPRSPEQSEEAMRSELDHMGDYIPCGLRGWSYHWLY
ncbi:uncharacterized protein LOC114737382 [Neltuma alba]|uniref:uncharacterized protein LOC114737382 n=1 Tax=Neltuma alba TaxID=207710 RepID=UPI0010A446E8|nr:uncharacterized protein LOC114737382 [Prosopis alba]